MANHAGWLHELGNSIKKGKFLLNQEEHLRLAVRLAFMHCESRAKMATMAWTTLLVLKSNLANGFDPIGLKSLKEHVATKGLHSLLANEELRPQEWLVKLDESLDFQELNSEMPVQGGSTLSIQRHKGYLLNRLTPISYWLFAFVFSFFSVVHTHLKREPGVTRLIYGLPMLLAFCGSLSTRIGDLAMRAMGSPFGEEPLAHLRRMHQHSQALKNPQNCGDCQDISGAEANYGGGIWWQGDVVIALGAGLYAEKTYFDILSGTSAFWGWRKASSIMAGFAKHKLDERVTWHKYQLEGYRQVDKGELTYTIKAFLHLTTGGYTNFNGNCNLHMGYVMLRHLLSRHASGDLEVGKYYSRQDEMSASDDLQQLVRGFRQMCGSILAMQQHCWLAIREMEVGPFLFGLGMVVDCYGVSEMCARAGVAQFATREDSGSKSLLEALNVRTGCFQTSVSRGGQYEVLKWLVNQKLYMEFGLAGLKLLKVPEAQGGLEMHEDVWWLDGHVPLPAYPKLKALSAEGSASSKLVELSQRIQKLVPGASQADLKVWLSNKESQEVMMGKRVQGSQTDLENEAYKDYLKKVIRMPRDHRPIEQQLDAKLQMLAMAQGLFILRTKDGASSMEELKLKRKGQAKTALLNCIPKELRNRANWGDLLAVAGQTHQSFDIEWFKRPNIAWDIPKEVFDKVKRWQQRIRGLGHYLFGEAPEPSSEAAQKPEDRIGLLKGTRLPYRSRKEQASLAAASELHFEDLLDYACEEGTKKVWQIEELVTLAGKVTYAAARFGGESTRLGSARLEQEARGQVWAGYGNGKTYSLKLHARCRPSRGVGGRHERVCG